MKIKIDVNNVTIIEKSDIHKGEYNINKCIFEFSSEYTKDLIYRAVFSCINGSYYQLILNNECNIPEEILREKDVNIELGVYAYILNDDNELELRYSPKPTYFRVENGSYKDADETEVPSPTDYEKFLNEFNRNATNKTEEFNQNYEDKKSEIDKVADEVAQNKTEIEEIEKRVKESEQNAKTSETNANTSEENAQNSSENASKILTNVTGIQTNINETKGQIDTIKEDIDAKAGQVNTAVEEATNQANISKEQADISITNAGKTSTDRTAIGNMKNDVSSMKSSVEQTKTDIQGIYNDTVYAKDETLQAKAEVENSLENERIESDKKYARAIESDTITIKNFGQVECDENGYMKEVSIESSLPEITQETREGYNIIDLTPVIEVSTIAGLNFEQINSNTIKLSGNSTSTWQAIRLRKTKEIISGNSYTIYAKMNYNGKSTKSAIRFGLFNKNGANFYNTNIMTLNLIDTNKTSAFFNFTPEFDEEENEISYFRFVIEGLEKDSKYDFELSVMLLEGVYNESNMPDFELYGISPSFDHPSDFKNIIQNIKVFNTKNDNFFDIKNCEKVNGYYSASGIFANDNNNISFLKISLPKGDITISSNYNISKILGFTGEDYSTGVILSGATNNFTFNNNGEYKYFGFYTSIINYNKSDFYVMINRGNVVLPYVPFNKGYAREIALPEGQFLGNLKGYSNAIDKGVLKGQLKELVLTGDESWRLFQTSTDRKSVV